MLGNRFGQAFSVTTFGESHGVALGCVIEGCPPHIPLCVEDVQHFLDRRRPGQSAYTTSRKEMDICEILSGVHEGRTLGTPICIMVRNHDQRPKDYELMRGFFRPSHSDYTTFKKYGLSPQSGGGRSSARETVGRVAAGAVAKAYVKHVHPGVEILSWVDRVGSIQAQVDMDSVGFEDIESSVVRCPDAQQSALMEELILQTAQEGDSLGGVVSTVMRHVPAGLGNPVFDKFEALLAQAMMSLPATKSFEVGTGLASTYMKGSAHNDPFYADENGNIRTKTNHSGGIQGGISCGMPIYFRVGFKPVSTIFKTQETVSTTGRNVTFQIQQGRHDACVLPRAVPIVEAMSWIVLAQLV
jgi:chorismate synthase